MQESHAWIYLVVMVTAAYFLCCLLEWVAKKRNPFAPIKLCDYKGQPLKQPIRVNIEV